MIKICDMLATLLNDFSLVSFFDDSEIQII